MHNDISMNGILKAVRLFGAFTVMQLDSCQKERKKKNNNNNANTQIKAMCVCLNIQMKFNGPIKYGGIKR